MTEDEAKTKACFKAATFGATQQLADGPGPQCLASACMAWRWHRATVDLLLSQDPPSHMTRKLGEPHANSSGNIVQRWGASTGYCGLAGAVA